MIIHHKTKVLAHIIQSKKRVRITATVKQIGVKSSFLNPYITFNHITIEGSVHLLSHYRMNYGKRIARLGELKAGDIVKMKTKIQADPVTLKDGTSAFKAKFIYPTQCKRISPAHAKRRSIPLKSSLLKGYIIARKHINGKGKSKIFKNKLNNFKNLYKRWKFAGIDGFPHAKTLYNYMPNIHTFVESLIDDQDMKDIEQVFNTYKQHYIQHADQMFCKNENDTIRNLFFVDPEYSLPTPSVQNLNQFKELIYKNGFDKDSDCQRILRSCDAIQNGAIRVVCYVYLKWNMPIRLQIIDNGEEVFNHLIAIKKGIQLGFLPEEDKTEMPTQVTDHRVKIYRPSFFL